MNRMITIGLISLMCVSCGRGSKNSDAFSRQEEQAPEPETLQRLYRADVRSVNPSIVEDIKGQLTIRLVEDDFEVNIALSDVPASTHPQRILSGKNCPTSGSDTDGDGIINYAEAQVASGATFIPLDSDIGNLGESNFPEASILGSYVYRETTSRSQLLAELGPGVEYDLENRVVMIYGTESDQTLPIGCAELFQVIGQE